MFPLNDLSLKTQPVQLNKVTSNTESTIKQHELVSDDAIINELSPAGNALSIDAPSTCATRNLYSSDTIAPN